MKRIPELSLMSNADQCSAFNTAPRKILRDIFLNSVEELITVHKNVVDLGCGPADYIIELCRQNPNCVITGIDGSNQMISIAQQYINNFEFNDRIFLKNILFDDIEEKFDTVISTNTLHHMHNPNKFWKIVKTIGKENVFVLDLIRPASNNAVEDIIKAHASNTNMLYQNDFRNSLKAAFSVGEIKKQLIDNGLQHLNIKILDNKVVIIYGSIHS